MRFSVNRTQVYNGVNCYLLMLTMGNATMKSVITYYFPVTTLKPTHYRIQTFVNNNLVYDQQYDITPGQTQGNTYLPSNTTTSIGYETVTVAAGTFANSMKMEATSNGEVTDNWVNSSVPIFGLVKSQTTKNGVVISSLELQSYGG
jgi:hypothetical protein